MGLHCTTATYKLYNFEQDSLRLCALVRILKGGGILVLFYESGSYYVALAGLELMKIHLLLFPKCWD